MGIRRHSMHSRLAEPRELLGSPNRWKALWVGVGTAIMAAVLTGSLPTPGQAAFSAPVPLSTPDVVGAKEAIDPSGDVFAVWSQRDAAGWRAQGRWISGSGTLGPVKTLSAAVQKPLWPQVAIDSFDYGATVVWSQPDGKNSRIEARHVSPQGRVSAVKNLSSRRRTSGLRIASAGGASPIVLWSQAHRGWRIKARTVSYTTIHGVGPLKLGPVKTLSSAGKKSKGPEAATDGDGHAVVVWSQRGGANSRIKTLSGPVKARRIERSGRLGSIKTLSKPGRGAGEAQVAIDGHGHAIAVWSQTNSKGAKPRIKARRLGAFAGAKTGVMTLSTKNSGTPDVASGIRGNATVVWDTTRGTKGRVQERQISPKKGLRGPAQTLSAAGGSANSPQVATGYGGNATVVWYVFQTSDEWPVQTRHVSERGKLGPLQTIASATGIRQPQIARNGGGRNGAFAVWSQVDGSTWRAWGSRGP
jgi:hypothetical protein